MKKILVLAISVIFTISSAMAEPIVELAAPRIQAPRVISGTGNVNSPSGISAQKAKSKKQKVKSIKS